MLLPSGKGLAVPELKSVSLKIEPLQYIAIYYDGSIFNETDVSKNFEDFSKMSIVRTSFEHSLNTIWTLFELEKGWKKKNTFSVTLKKKDLIVRYLSRKLVGI